jgi:menaquinone-dependent protoporphyrinogen oxidase
MTAKILVTYATKHGSTQEIAEVISETMRNNGLNVDIRMIKDVKSLEDFSFVILGAPLYMFRWHKDAHRFLSKHQRAIKNGLPVAVFAGGPFGKNEENIWQATENQLEKELTKHPWFKPQAIQIVGGKFNPEELRFPYNLIPAMRQLDASDLRDWEAIRSWTRSIIPQTQAA